MANLRELTDYVFHGLNEIIKEQDADMVLEPAVFVIRGDEAARLPVTPMFAIGAEGRSMVAAAIRSIAASVGMDAYLICAESFIVDELYDADEVYEIQRDGIADHSRRKECIMMTAGNAQGTIVRVWIMHRDENGKVAELVEYVLPDGVNMEGRFHDLLKATIH